MNVCVFCSASDVADKYVEPSQRLGELLARDGHTLVWGGSDTGLMRVVAAAVQDAGGRIVGISMELLKDRIRQGADEMIIAATLGERKALMLERADALVILVGGIGTLDEASEILELKKHRIHDKPVIVLDTDGFYDGLRLQLQRMDDEGFLPRPLDQLMTFATTPEEAIEQLSAVVV